MKLVLDLQLTKPAFKLTGKLQLEWPKAGIHVLFGPSGCGKSHLLRSICGLEKARGHISFNDATWLDSLNKKEVPCHKRNVAMVFQDSQLFPHLNVKQNLLFAFKRSSATLQDLESAIDHLKISHLLEHNVKQLSGGEKQRVSICRSILSKPDLLLMDEPLASLDWQSKAEILPYIQGLSREWQLPILYVSHDLDEVMQLADNIVFMDKQDGVASIIKVGSLLELLQDINNPFNKSNKACSVIEGMWKHEPFMQDGLAKVQLEEQAIYLNQSHYQQNNVNARLTINASDVSISLSHALDSSILNILNAQIQAIKYEDSGQCLIQLLVDGQTLLSRISGYSAKRLHLKEGQNVFAQIKAVALSK
jgi:molybdate transport system ATP-binding protein